MFCEDLGGGGVVLGEDLGECLGGLDVWLSSCAGFEILFSVVLVSFVTWSSFLYDSCPVLFVLNQMFPLSSISVTSASSVYFGFPVFVFVFTRILSPVLIFSFFPLCIFCSFSLLISSECSFAFFMFSADSLFSSFCS